MSEGAGVADLGPHLDPHLDLDLLRQWVGRTQEAEALIAPFPAAAMAGLLDRERAPGPGDELPLPWHWLYFLETPRRSEVGVDGHPRRGGFLPPVPLARRMWASGRIEVQRLLRIGELARKVSTVQRIELKQGKAGPLVFVTVLHDFHQQGLHCLREAQDLVYRAAPQAPAPLAPGEPAPTQAGWQDEFEPDTATLARFSALTYNGHRIHYDRDYAVREEHYPALVVHGPLQAALLLDLQQRHRPAARVRHFDFRAVRPAFDTERMALRGQPALGPEGRESGCELWTQGPQGFVCMRARVQYEHHPQGDSI